MPGNTSTLEMIGLSLRKTLLRIAILFVGLFALTIPFPHALLPDPGTAIAPATESIVGTLSDLLGMHHPREISSDSASMYVLAGLALALALAGGMVWSILTPKGADNRKLIALFMVGMRYYLAAYLLEYGFNKVFKAQFFLPEPNTLATPIGDLGKDILFWSTMGVSRGYCIFTGLLEVAAGSLLLFGRTRVPGAILAAAVLLNVLAINLFFDISVKLFSGFLLLQSCLLLVPDCQRLLGFMLENASPASPVWRPSWDRPMLKRAYRIMKSIVVFLLFADCLYPYFVARNFNDDDAPRPHLHGYYEVPLFIRNGDTVAPDLRANRWRRVFVHRHGFFITQNMQDAFQDYEMHINEMDSTISLIHTADQERAMMRFKSLKDGFSRMQGEIGGAELEVLLQAVDWRSMPLLKPSFHWTSDTM